MKFKNILHSKLFIACDRFHSNYQADKTMHWPCHSEEQGVEADPGLSISRSISLSPTLARSIAFSVGFLLQSVSTVQFQPYTEDKLLILPRKKTSCADELVNLLKRILVGCPESHRSSRGRNLLKRRENIQWAEEERGDAFKIEIIDIHYNHGLACFPTDKKGQQSPSEISFGLNYSGMSKKIIMLLSDISCLFLGSDALICLPKGAVSLLFVAFLLYFWPWLLPRSLMSSNEPPISSGLQSTTVSVGKGYFLCS